MSDHFFLRKRGLRLGAAFLLILFFISLDQFTKALAVSALRGKAPAVLVPSVLELLYTENTGAAFGILKGQQWFFYCIAGVVSAFALYTLWRLPAKRRMLPLYFDLCLIVSGALGNVIDRLRLGYVVDFIYFKPIDFPVFNVADIYITCACGMLILLFLFYYKEEDLKFL